MNISSLKLALGSDHAGYKLKQVIINFLFERQISYNDYGTFSEESVDYPDFAHLVAKSLLDGDANYGILICGSGNGVNMTANKYCGIRAALCWNSEIARLARLHNDANILSLPGRFIEEDEAIKCVIAFLDTGFEGGRHIQRVNKISQLL